MKLLDSYAYYDMRFGNQAMCRNYTIKSSDPGEWYINLNEFYSWCPIFLLNKN